MNNIKIKFLISIFSLILICFIIEKTYAQTNIISTNPSIENVLMGNYNPISYQATNVINHPDSVSKGVYKGISSDSLKVLLEHLASFQNRNTGSDTVSSTRGIGAARRWVRSKFQEYSSVNENRLLTGYLQFDQIICGANQHRNVLGVLPGTDTTDLSIIIIEGHLDSRCEDRCDTACSAQGMEDNASGTALVMELARVMSRFSFEHTIVFMATIGEEQGLLGANAFATYCVQNNIPIKAVLNNDVIGGIVCGQTSSAPSCPSPDHIDSTQVRIFSSGGFNSKHKSFARYIKLEYEEELKPIVSVPMLVSIMSAEDRTGRGGDHIPFRQMGFTAVRFTSANEHGHGNPAAAGYSDRQHTMDDVLGIDLDGDGILDSFFVDFNYLARNAVINGNAAGLLGNAPDEIINFSVSRLPNNRVEITVNSAIQHPAYRIGLRTLSHDFDTIFTITGSNTGIFEYNKTTFPFQYFTVASVDSFGIESLFSDEKRVFGVGINDLVKGNQGIELLQNRPNPFDEATIIAVYVHENKKYKSAIIKITDLLGRVIQRLPIQLNQGINEVIYDHGYQVEGTFIYSLIIDGQLITSKKMQFEKRIY